MPRVTEGEAAEALIDSLKILIAVAERPKIRIGSRPIVSVALKTTEGGYRRTLLDTGLNRRTIQTERLRALARAHCPTVRIGKVRIAISARLNVFPRERPCGDSGE
jgi:hypothetical protein